MELVRVGISEEVDRTIDFDGVGKWGSILPKNGGLVWPH